MSVVITREVAQRCVEVVDKGLSSGLGVREPGQFCVEAAICYALGLPHGDDPGCVSPALRQLKIGLNDRQWSSPAARAAGLRRLALAQLGSKGALDDKAFVRRVVDMTIRKAVPAGLRSAARCYTKRWPEYAAKLEAAAVRCEQEGTRESCKAAEVVAREARSAAAAADADAAAASAAAYDAAYAAAYAADAAAAASAAAAAAADAYAYDAASASARDRALADYAEWVVEILIDMQAPGCQWLDLVPKAA